MISKIRFPKKIKSKTKTKKTKKGISLTQITDTADFKK